MREGSVIAVQPTPASEESPVPRDACSDMQQLRRLTLCLDVSQDELLHVAASGMPL